MGVSVRPLISVPSVYVDTGLARLVRLPAAAGTCSARDCLCSEPDPELADCIVACEARCCCLFFGASSNAAYCRPSISSCGCDSSPFSSILFPLHDECLLCSCCSADERACPEPGLLRTGSDVTEPSNRPESGVSTSGRGSLFSVKASTFLIDAVSGSSMPLRGGLMLTGLAGASCNRTSGCSRCGTGWRPKSGELVGGVGCTVRMDPLVGEPGVRGVWPLVAIVSMLFARKVVMVRLVVYRSMRTQSSM